MSENSGKRVLAGNRLYIILAVWLVLVIAGGLCTWYGWFGRSMQPSQPEAAPTATTPATEAPTAPPAPTLAAVEEEPTVAPQPPPAAEVAEEVFGYGIAIHGTGGGDVGYMLGQVESLGMGWVKQQMRWDDVERSEGQMEWGLYDWVVEEANNRGIKVMFSIVDAPDWKRSAYVDATPEGAPPEDLADLAEFLGQVVDRYQGRIHAIEVWNEQNLDREWDTAEGVSPERYVEMLRLGYQAIKSRDPNIVVISGALSNLGFTAGDPNNPNRLVVMDDFQYMDGMVAAGVLDYCDCVGAHHNGFNMPPNIAWDEGYDDPTAKFRGPFDNIDHSWSFKSTLWGYHDRIAAVGSDRPLCITEFGWATAEGFDGYPPGFEFALDNTLNEQAEWDVQAFQLMREWGFVRIAFLWNLNFSQLGWGPEDPNAPYAIIDFDGVARPAYGAVGAMQKP